MHAPSLAPLALLGAYAAALALTLALAAWCTPRGWWRRPNLRALGVLSGGTLGFGLLFSMLFTPGVAPAAAAQAGVPAVAALPVFASPGPAPGARYRAIDPLNLRAAHGVRAARVLVLPAGTLVRTTGAVDGDWWQVRARVDGHAVDGWASSLWLRRVDER